MRVQSGMKPPPPPSKGAHRILRGVVINVYFPEEEDRPGVTGAARGSQKIQAIAVDVLTYGGGNHWFLPRIPVAQPRHALVDHDLWVPRPTTRNVITGEELLLPDTRTINFDRLRIADPRDLDGDHVLVEMLEGDTHQAFVRYDQLPHPRANLRLERADNVVARSRVRGVVQTVDGDGNLTIDTTNANSGATSTGADGNIVETPALDADHGRVDVLVNHNAEVNIRGLDADGADEKFHLHIKDGELLIRLAGGTSMLVTGEGAGTVTTLGDGTAAAVQAAQLEALWTSFVTYMNTTLSVATGMGPSGPAITPPPAWNDLIASTKLKFPSG